MPHSVAFTNEVQRCVPGVAVIQAPKHCGRLRVEANRQALSVGVNVMRGTRQRL